MNDLDKAVKALQEKQEPFTRFWNYYDGNQPLRYSTKKLREFFKGLDAHFAENWCSVVIDSCHDKISLTHFNIADNDEESKFLNEIFIQTQLNLDADDVHKAAQVCGESYVIAWIDDDDKPEAYYNDPRNCWIRYDPDHPRRKEFGAKWWDDEETEKRFVNLYYADRIEYWQSKDKAEKFLSLSVKDIKSDLFETRKPDGENKYGQVPVFRFAKERRAIKSDLVDMLDLQDAINKLVNDMMIDADVAALPQRYIVSQMDPGQIARHPGAVINIPQSDKESHAVEVGQFDVTPLKNYLDGIEHFTLSAGVITRTPKHYFFGQGGDPSGEALIAMEAPLNKKAGSYIKRFTPEWRFLMSFLMLLSGKVVDPWSIEPMFAKVETVQPRTQAEIREIDVRTGIPLKTVLRDDDWTEEELKQLDKDAAEEDAKVLDQQAKLAAATTDTFNSGGTRKRE